MCTLASRGQRSARSPPTTTKITKQRCMTSTKSAAARKSIDRNKQFRERGAAPRIGAPPPFRLMRNVVIFAALAFINSAARAQSQATLIVNAKVIDGTGAPARAAEVRIVDGRVNAIGHWTRNPSDRVIDAHGLTLAPGFIDTHSHHDRGLFDHRDALAAVSQGITTIVVGQDGESRFPLAQFFTRLDSNAAAVNVASYVGHGSVRRRVIGDDFQRVATDSE